MWSPRSAHRPRLAVTMHHNLMLLHPAVSTDCLSTQAVPITTTEVTRSSVHSRHGLTASIPLHQETHHVPSASIPRPILARHIASVRHLSHVRVLTRCISRQTYPDRANPGKGCKRHRTHPLPSGRHTHFGPTQQGINDSSVNPTRTPKVQGSRPSTLGPTASSSKHPLKPPAPPADPS